jgi:type I restriction enzyme, S subunit
MDSLIGPVPSAWRQVMLEDVCEILVGPSGARFRVEARSSANVPVVMPRDLRNNRIAHDGTSAAAIQSARALARYRLAAGDVVCSRTGDLGRQALVGREQHDWLVGSACFRLRPHNAVNGSYLVYYLAHPTVRDWIVRNATGSAIPSLNTRTIATMPVVLPPAEIQSMVGDVLGALDEKIAVHRQISSTTAALRDSLLPLLLNRSAHPGRDHGDTPAE